MRQQGQLWQALADAWRHGQCEDKSKTYREQETSPRCGWIAKIRGVLMLCRVCYAWVGSMIAAFIGTASHKSEFAAGRAAYRQEVLGPCEVPAEQQRHAFRPWPLSECQTALIGRALDTCVQGGGIPSSPPREKRECLQRSLPGTIWTASLFPPQQHATVQILRIICAKPCGTLRTTLLCHLCDLATLFC